MTTLRVDLPVSLLTESVRAVPSASGTLVDISPVDGATYRVLVRVRLVDERRFEAALGEDETVAGWAHVASGTDDHLYRIQVGADRLAVRAYRHAVQLDGYLIAARVESSGWHVRLLFPDRAAVSTFTRRCRADGVRHDVRAIQDTDGSRAGPADELTGAQAETLRVGVEEGYFDVPRRATLETLATDLDVSKQAVSERLRRGLRTLLTGALETSTAGGRDGASTAGGRDDG